LRLITFSLTKTIDLSSHFAFVRCTKNASTFMLRKYKVNPYGQENWSLAPLWSGVRGWTRTASSYTTFSSQPKEPILWTIEAAFPVTKINTFINILQVQTRWHDGGELRQDNRILEAMVYGSAPCNSNTGVTPRQHRESRQDKVGHSERHPIGGILKSEAQTSRESGTIVPRGGEVDTEPLFLRQGPPQTFQIRIIVFRFEPRLR
jgi:hypothetical protein